MSTRQAISERSTTQRQLSVEETDEFYVIKNARVLNEVSRNGGTYTRRARESAARLANYLPLSIEHTSDDGQRRYNDRVGQLRSGRLTEDGQVEADLYVNKGHDRSKQIAIDAKHFPQNINLSVELPPEGWIGEDKRPHGGYVVEDISQMLDCCIVARGGTTNTLYEGHVPRTEPDEEEMTATTTPPTISNSQITEAVRASLTEAEEKRKVQETIDRQTREIEDQKAVISKLQEQLKKYKDADERRAKAAQIIEQAKALGAGDITDKYAATLAKLDDTEVETMLKERANTLKNAGQLHDPIQVHAPSVGASSGSSNQFSWLRG